MSKLLLKGGRVVDPTHGVDETADTIGRPGSHHALGAAIILERLEGMHIGEIVNRTSSESVRMESESVRINFEIFRIESESFRITSESFRINPYSFRILKGEICNSCNVPRVFQQEDPHRWSKTLPLGSVVFSCPTLD